jgi:hypothetical protein
MRAATCVVTYRDMCDALVFERPMTVQVTEDETAVVHAWPPSNDTLQ